MAPRLCLIMLGNYITTRSYRLANNCYAPAAQQWRSELLPSSYHESSIPFRFRLNKFEKKLDRSIKGGGFEYLVHAPVAPHLRIRPKIPLYLEFINL